MTWVFSEKSQKQEFRTKKLALAYIREEGWRRWAGNREVIIFVRDDQPAAGLRKTRGTVEISE